MDRVKDVDVVKFGIGLEHDAADRNEGEPIMSMERKLKEIEPLLGSLRDDHSGEIKPFLNFMPTPENGPALDIPRQGVARRRSETTFMTKPSFLW